MYVAALGTEVCVAQTDQRHPHASHFSVEHRAGETLKETTAAGPSSSAVVPAVAWSGNLSHM
jgi:hypothetical protein